MVCEHAFLRRVAFRQAVTAESQESVMGHKRAAGRNKYEQEMRLTHGMKA